MATTIGEYLDKLTVTGELYRKLSDGTIECYACGHRCKIRVGRRGICQVRFNEGGELRVPWGYVAALQSDPVEKKPFFHVMPGTNALTFGMLGCDFHCGYCFTGDTLVMTDRGPLTFEEAFDFGVTIREQPDGDISVPLDLKAVTSSGGLHSVKAVFRHPYEGEMVTIQPYHLPSVTCTPDHRVYATDDIHAAPVLVRAKDLTRRHFLAIPRSDPDSSSREIEELQEVVHVPAAGRFSQGTGERLGRSRPAVRPLRNAYRNGRAPAMLFHAPREAQKAYLEAFVEDHGCRPGNGKISLRTASRKLAYGIAWLALGCGYFPSICEDPKESTAESYSVVWSEEPSLEPGVFLTEKFFLLPIRDITGEYFRGSVFNMEVEEEHNYLANFLLVSNCQNWMTSQAMRDPASDLAVHHIREISPEAMISLARRTNASVVVSSYNEPLITSEWAVEIFKEAKSAGLMCAYVSNGNNTPEVMEYIRPYISAYKVDLKCMQDKNYRKLGGVLQNTLDGIKRAHDMGLWVEIVTLTIPGFNDSNEELWDAARFIASVSRDIPWHVTAFHKDYKMTDPDNTDARTLLRAADIGREAGLRYVYAGNLPGQVGDYEDTFCPGCNERLIRRTGYIIREYRITGEGTCPKCHTKIPGVWPRDPSQVALNGLGIPLPVY
jgi:pyruvate formate lyase activating enzyme